MGTAKKTSKNVVKRHSKTKAQLGKKKKTIPKKRIEKGFWETPFMIGEQLHSNNIENIKKGPQPGEEQWDFTNLEAQLCGLKMEHSGCNLFLYSSNELACMNIGGVQQVIHLPVINVIVCDSSEKGDVYPPEFVSIKRSQLGTEVIKTFKEMKLEWIKSPQMDSLYYLNCLQRKERLKKEALMVQHEYEYALLFTMKPETDWALDKKGKLSVDRAMFQFKKEGDLEVIEEMFDKENGDVLRDFIPDFIERNDIDGDRDDLDDKIRHAIKVAFDKARTEKEKRKKLFSTYSENFLNSTKVVKIYPQNEFITQNHKSPYVNPYYGKAHEVV